MKNINLKSIRLPEFESTMPISVNDLLRQPWTGSAIAAEGGFVMAETWPSAEHEGYIHYRVMDCRGGMSLSSKRPTTPEFAGGALDSALAPCGLSCQALRWRSVERSVPATSVRQIEFANAAGPTLPTRGEFVYFLEAGKFIKIGKTNGRPDSRISTLQTGCPYPIYLVAYMAGGLKDEFALHKQFSHLRAHGEWFRNEGAMAEFVAHVAVQNQAAGV